MATLTEEDILKQIAELENESTGYGSPDAPVKDSTLKFFRELINGKDSTKFANLQKNELGNVKLTVRNQKRIERFASEVGLEDVARYFNGSAEDIMSTSLGLKGFMAQLFVTQIKKEQKLKEPEKKKEGWFAKKEAQDEQ